MAEVRDVVPPPHPDVRRTEHLALQPGLRLILYGAICVRGEPCPLRPFLPSLFFG